MPLFTKSETFECMQWDEKNAKEIISMVNKYYKTLNASLPDLLGNPLVIQTHEKFIILTDGDWVICSHSKQLDTRKDLTFRNEFKTGKNDDHVVEKPNKGKIVITRNTATTKEEFALRLHRNECSNLLPGECYNETKDNDRAIAKENGFIVMYGQGDSDVIICGAAEGEFCTYEGSTIYTIDDRIIENEILCDFTLEYSHETLVKSLVKHGFVKTTKKINVIWSKSEIQWKFETDIPHATFDIMEGSEIFCRGIVISQEDLKDEKEDK